MRPESNAAADIAGLWWAMLVGSAVVFAIVVALLLVAVLKRRGAPDAGTGGWVGSLWFVGAGGIVAPAVALTVLFAFTLGTLPATSSPTRGDAQLTIDVTGRQWFWDVSYPAQDVRSANEIHVPVGVPVEVRVTSGDVIHSFWVPRLTRKIDMIPGRTNSVLLEADRAGVYRGQCAEFCGVQHAHMAFFVVAEPRTEFDAWLRAEGRPAAPPSTALESQGLQVLLGSACVYCHRIAGTNATGEVGPDLTHLASRRSIAAALLGNTRGSLAAWILDPQHLKPGNRMPATDLTGGELEALLAYLESLR